MSNFHFHLSLKLPQGKVHDFSGEVQNYQKFSGEVQKISGEVRTSTHLKIRPCTVTEIYLSAIRHQSLFLAGGGGGLVAPKRRVD